LVDIRTAEYNRLDSTPDCLRAAIQTYITWLDQWLTTLDDDLDTILRPSPLWRHHTIWGGRAHVQATLYRGTLVAVRPSPILKAFYERLCGAGKTKKWRWIACLCKLLTILNAIVNPQKPWHMQEAANAYRTRPP
jgi:hypothetical protein